MSEDSSKQPPRLPSASWGPLAGVLYGFGVALLGAQIGVAILLGLVLEVFGSGSSAAISEWTGTIHGQFIFTMSIEIAMFCAIILYIKRHGASLKSVGLNRPRLKYLLYVLTGTIIYFLIYLVAISVVGILIPSLDLQQEQELGFNNPHGTVQLAMVFMSLVILPPIAEETVFRGFIFAGLRRKWPFVASAVVTSVLFAAGHLQVGNGVPLLWVAAIDTFVLSMVLCYVREKTGSIWPTIGIHALKNLVAFTLLYLVVI